MNNIKKIFLIPIAALLIMFVVISLIFTKSKVEVEIIVSPTDSILTLDGNPIKPGKVTLENGEHTLKATHEFFVDATKKVKTSELKQNEIIYLVPSPNSPEAHKWLADHPDNSGLRERAGAAAAQEKYAEIEKAYPFLKKLPHESLNYKIDYSLTADDQLTLFVTLYPYAKPGRDDERTQQLKDFKTEALNFLKDNGVDIAKTNITYDPEEASKL